MFPFDPNTPEALRQQILAQQMADVLTDRERAAFYGLPEGCRIRERAKILAPENLKCGHHVWIGEGAILDAQGGLEIGDYSQIGSGVFIWSHASHRQARDSQTCQTKEGIDYRPTRIGKNCYLPGPSAIGPGVTIGDRVIISPCSYVSHDLPDDTVFSPHRDAFRLQARVTALEEQLRQLAGQLAALAPDDAVRRAWEALVTTLGATAPGAPASPGGAAK